MGETSEDFAYRDLREVMTWNHEWLARARWEAVFARLLADLDAIDAERARLEGLTDAELWEERMGRKLEAPADGR